MRILKQDMIVKRIREVVQEFSDKNAIIFNDHQIKYTQLEEITNKLANGLRNSGLKAGDRIALMMPNVPHFLFSYYAILKIGAIVVPINYMMEEDEVIGVLKSLKPHAIIYWEGFRKYIRNYLEICNELSINIVLGNTKSIDNYNILKLISQSKPEFETQEIQINDTAVIQYTSGVSEPPKGIELSYSNLLASIEGCTTFFRFNESDVFGAILPLFFIFSQNVLLNGALFCGGTIVIHTKLDYQKIAQSIDEHKFTVLAGTPNFYQTLVDLKQNSFSGSSLKYCLSSWHQFSEELENKFEKSIGIPLLNCYSMTETCGIVAANHPSIERKYGSVGLVLPDIDIQIHNEQRKQLHPNEIGEIVVQGKNVLKSFWNGSELVSEQIKNGWFYTGDCGKKDEQGHIYIVNKKAEVIVKSGFPIYTNEIEQLLAKHPKVKEAVVIATPHPNHKEDVQACIALKENELATAEEIIEYCRSYMPVYKCPQLVKFYPSLPRTKMGRIFKRKL